MHWIHYCLPLLHLRLPPAALRPCHPVSWRWHRVTASHLLCPDKTYNDRPKVFRNHVINGDFNHVIIGHIDLGNKRKQFAREQSSIQPCTHCSPKTFLCLLPAIWPSWQHVTVIKTRKKNVVWAVIPKSRRIATIIRELRSPERERQWACKISYNAGKLHCV